MGEDERINEEIRAIYNSGDCKRALELSIPFLERFPESRFARYRFAVMHGDYSYTPGLDEAEKARLLVIAKNGVSELLNDPDFSRWPIQFQTAVRNEYYWFFELPDQQYDLGLERIKEGDNGHYSACVGASMQAVKALRAGQLQEAEDWAAKSLYHFAEFETLVPKWYNINHFSSRALLCLGRYDDAKASYVDMFRKQGNIAKADEIAEFESRAKEILDLRTKAKPTD